MLRLELPAAPFLIAFILGPLFEDNFRRSLLISKGSFDIFLRSGICWFFLVLTVITIAVIVRRNFTRTRKAQPRREQRLEALE